jgi:hypothetical protein
LRVQKYLDGAIVVLSPAPNVLRWSIQLSIVATLLAPFFDEVAMDFGSRVRFADVMHHVTHMHFSAMLAAMKQALFS